MCHFWPESWWVLLLFCCRQHCDSNISWTVLSRFWSQVQHGLAQWENVNLRHVHLLMPVRFCEDQTSQKLIVHQGLRHIQFSLFIFPKKDKPCKKRKTNIYLVNWTSFIISYIYSLDIIDALKCKQQNIIKLSVMYGMNYKLGICLYR